MAGSSTSRSLVLVAAVLFSTGGAVIKASSLSGLEIAAARSALAAGVLWLLLPSWRRFWRPRPLAVGAFYAATLVCFVVATKLTIAANAIFLQSTAPIYVLLLAPRLLGEPNQRSDYFVTLLLMLGMGMFFIGVDPAFDTAPNPGLGDGIAVAAGVTLAFGLMGLRWLSRAPDLDGENSSGQAVVAGNVLAAAACLPFVLPLPTPGAVDVLLLFYLGSIQIGLGYWLLTRGVRGLPAIEVSLLLLAEPVLNTFWAYLVHGEAPGAWSLAGCSVILSATCVRVLLQRGDSG
jgi:DME family drug/metabolite transporter